MAFREDPQIVYVIWSGFKYIIKEKSYLKVYTCPIGDEDG